MPEFLRNSDAFIWSIEADPRLRSTIVSLVMVDRAPNWEQLVDRFELLSRTMPMFRQRVTPSLHLCDRDQHGYRRHSGRRRFYDCLVAGFDEVLALAN
jgi:hypothetical protein